MPLPPLPPPRVIGHRGAAAHAPENTLAGIRKAHELGARWVEFDVQATRDNCAVLLHDPRLERTTDGYGLLADQEARDIARLDAGRWFGKAFGGEAVPRFDAAMELIDGLGMGAIIEIKSGPGDGARTARAMLASLGPAASPHIISSFGEDALAIAAAERPDMARALLVRAIPADWRVRVERLGCSALHAGERELTPQIVAEVALHCVLRAYTVNKPERAAQLFAWGAAAVFTDCPDVILSGIEHGTDGPRASRGSKAQ